MKNRLSTDQAKAASVILERLDRVASDIQANHEKWGMSIEDARLAVNHLDKVADAFEVSVFGADSFHRRQVEVLKTAKVLVQDKDEPYMSSFVVDHGVVQSDADEPYMSAYSDDQSSAVQEGKSTTGRPLAP